MAALYNEEILKSVVNNLKCSICLDIFTEPVTLYCGHNFCLECIKAYISNERKSDCPQCRKEFSRDFKLQKNVNLCNIVELHEAGGRGMWERVDISTSSEQEGFSCSKPFTDGIEPKVETLMRRLKFLKSEIKTIEDTISTELPRKHDLKDCSWATREDSGAFETGAEEVCNLSSGEGESQQRLDSGVHSLISGQGDSLEDSISQLEQADNLIGEDETSPEENKDNFCSLAWLFQDLPSSPIAHRQNTEEFARLTFTPELGHRHLTFLTERRKVEVVRTGRPALHNRFDISQWMAVQEFSEGAHYWEVGTADSKGWAVGVAYPSLGRGDRLGRTSTSWCVEWSSGRLSYWHNNTEDSLKHGCPRQVRVVLDMANGSLSFYSLSTLLYNVQVDFTAPVRPVFWLFGLQSKNALSFPEPFVSVL